MITILFATKRTLLSRVIRAMSKSDVSHCGFGVEIDGVQLVADCALLGCEMVTRERWMRGRTVLHEFYLPAASTPPLGSIVAYLGAGYDYSGMLGYLPVWIARWFGRILKNPWASPTLNVCSEYVVRVIQKHDRTWLHLDPEGVYPSDIVLACERRGLARVA